MGKASKSKRDVNVVHNKEAAVKYFTWDNDQWISYDDADTFQQTVDWADQTGFSGSLIWASDLGKQFRGLLAPSPIYEGYLLETKDDYQATAHASLTGKSVSAIHTGISIKAKKDLTATISDFDASLGKNCYKRSDAATYCRKGDVRVGYDKAGRKVR